MTIVNLKYRRIDGVTPEGTLVTSGLVEVTPAYRSDTGSGQLTTIADTYPVGSTIVLAPGTYLFRLRASDGRGGRLKDEGVYRLVPAAGTFDVDDLQEVTPTAQGMTQSDVAAMIAAAVAGIVVGPGGTPTGTGPGGAFYIQDVLDSTATGRAVVKAADATAGRTALSAAAATHTHVATTDLTATGTKNTTTFLRGDNTWAAPSGVVAGSVDWANVTSKPSTFPATIGTTAGTAADGGVVQDIVTNGSPLAASVSGSHTFTGPITFSSTVGFVDGSIAQADVAGLVAELLSLRANTVQRIVWNGTGYPAEIAGYASYWYSGPSSQPPSSHGRTLRPGDVVDAWAG